MLSESSRLLKTVTFAESTEYSAIDSSVVHISDQKNGLEIQSPFEVDDEVFDNIGNHDNNYILQFIRKWIDSRLSKEKQDILFLSLIIFCLILCTSLERLSFKVFIDRMTPFRMVVEMAIILGSSAAYSLIVVWRKAHNRTTQNVASDIEDFPWKTLFTMAFIDVAYISGLIISTSEISPVATMILIHSSVLAYTIISVAILKTSLSLRYIQGLCFILIALATYLIVPFLHLTSNKSSWPTAISNIIYLISSLLFGCSMFYKENYLNNLNRPPIDIYQMNSWLFICQSFVFFICAPFVYLMQNISFDGRGFPLNTFQDNLEDGIECLFGYTPSSHEIAIPEYDVTDMLCDIFDYHIIANIWLLLIYVLANIGILECSSIIVKMNAKYVGISIPISLIITFILLKLYESISYTTVDKSTSLIEALSVLILIFGTSLMLLPTTKIASIE